MLSQPWQRLWTTRPQTSVPTEGRASVQESKIIIRKGNINIMTPPNASWNGRLRWRAVGVDGTTNRGSSPTLRVLLRHVLKIGGGPLDAKTPVRVDDIILYFIKGRLVIRKGFWGGGPSSHFVLESKGSSGQFTGSSALNIYIEMTYFYFLSTTFLYGIARLEKN